MDVVVGCTVWSATTSSSAASASRSTSSRKRALNASTERLDAAAGRLKQRRHRQGRARDHPAGRVRTHPPNTCPRTSPSGPAMGLNERSSAAISPTPRSGMRTAKSPPPAAANDPLTGMRRASRVILSDPDPGQGRSDVRRALSALYLKVRDHELYEFPWPRWRRRSASTTARSARCAWRSAGSAQALARPPSEQLLAIVTLSRSVGCCGSWLTTAAG